MTTVERHLSDRARLHALAVRAMRERGLAPEFPRAALAEAASATPATSGDGLRDERNRLWCSIDNDDSRDLDQLSVAEERPGGVVRVLVAIADVDALAPKGSAIDVHAAVNTTSVYTPGAVFPMLPERFSTDLTSLGQDDDRLAIVIALDLAADATLVGSEVYRAVVRNRAKLAYNSVAAWLTGEGPLPAPAAAVPGLDAQLRLQDKTAQLLADRRHEQGALEFATLQTRPTFVGDTLQDLQADAPNRAKSLIENLMVAANGVTARFLEAKRFPSLRRVVKSPKRWDRIVAVAAEAKFTLPGAPDSRALNAFLAERRAADPDGFPDLSTTVIKLLGSGEYVMARPGEDPPGHFGLAVKDYTHSTAPNRRYPDLLTQRLLKAALAGKTSPYDDAVLTGLAEHCTRQEDNAEKVERQIRKSAAALVATNKVGQRFAGLITGASPKGTFVRVLVPPIEGKVVTGFQGLDVGDRVTVRLSHVDVDRGFIDFVLERQHG
ncbi:MAG: RNB domain-containing ribonuclease [Acidobacteriota bacterium]